MDIGIRFFARSIERTLDEPFLFIVRPIPRSRKELREGADADYVAKWTLVRIIQTARKLTVAVKLA